MKLKFILIILAVVAAAGFIYYWKFSGGNVLKSNPPPKFCWKWSEGRGVGTVPGYCDPETQVKSGLLCYPKPKPGYTMVAGVAWQNCPNGYTDTGGHCLKPGAYGRGEWANTWADWNRDKCENQVAEKSRAEGEMPQYPGCEKSGALWYHKCKHGFHPVGCCVCSPNCPDGMIDIGVSCQKDSYVVAPITPTCGKDQVYDAGLCYRKCGEGQYGVGPVCYKKCPAGMTPCGINEELSAACGVDAGDCAKQIFNMVTAVGNVVYKIVDTVVTGGGFSNLTQIAKDSTIKALKTAAKSAAKEVAKLSLEQVKAAIKKENPNLSPAEVDNLANMQKNPEGFDYAKFLTNIDPTGIAEVVKSFNHGICK
jgi:hypothetical protein